MNYHDKTKEELISELQKLQETNFHNLAENIQDGIVIANSAGQHVYINRRASEILQYSYEEFFNITLKDLVDPSAFPLLNQRFRDRIAGLPVPSMYESIIYRKDGSFFQAEITGSKTIWRGEIVDLVVFRDITLRKKAEVELQQSKRELTTLMNNLPGMVYSSLNDKDWTMVFVNEGSLNLTGYLPNELTGGAVKFNDIIYPDDQDFVWETIQCALKNRITYTLEYRIITKSGLIKHVWERGQGIFDENSNLHHLEGFISNITELKQAAYEKEKTQKLLEDSQRIGKIGGWEINIDTMELEWTKEMYNIHEVDLSFKPIVDQRVNFYTPESLSVIDNAVRKAIERGDSYEVDLEIITAKGNLRSVKTIGKADLENRRVYGFFQDITENKLAEKALIRSEIELKRAQQLTHIGSFYIDLTTNQVIWSEELYKMYGFDPALPPPLLNESQELFTPESWKLLSDSIANTVRTGIPYEIELRTKRKDGTNGWMWARGETIKNFEGKITNLWGAVQDITERKKAEEELHEVNAYLENLINYANAPIIVWDPQFRITRFNHAFEFITGYTEAEVLGKTLDILFPPDLVEDSMELIRKTLTGERWETVEIQIQHRSKSIRTLLWNSATLFLTDEKSPIATIAQGSDITERKQAEIALKNSEAQLKELNATKDRFFSIIAHDLKSPFNNILGFSGMLNNQVRDLDIESIAKYADIINSSAQQTFNLLENLLDWARMQQGGFHFQPKKLLINTLINNELDGLKYNADQKEISLINLTNEDSIITADEKMIGSVIRNLISNAIKFTAKEGLVTIEAKTINDHVEISITDTGVGMQEETLNKLFKIETSFSSRGTGNEKGSGLGLLLCKEFVEKHGGKIWVMSELEKGSKFTFSILK